MSDAAKPEEPTIGKCGHRCRISRRKFIAAAVGLVAGAGIANVGYATYVEPRWVEVTCVEISIDSLPPSFDGLRIVQLSDIHSSSVVPPDYIEHCINLTAQLDPDLVLLTGDYVTGRASFIHPVVAALKNSLSHCRKIACLGNHDYWADARTVRNGLEEADVCVLCNESVKVAHGKEYVWIVGLHDYWSGLFDPDEPFADLPPGEPKIVLSHNPDTFVYLRDRGVDLLLCGHTHGGQVNLPLIGRPFVPSRYGARYACGLFDFGRMRMYVNRGIGVIPPPVRFRVRPEITQIVLRRREAKVCGS